MTEERALEEPIPWDPNQLYTLSCSYCPLEVQGRAPSAAALAYQLDFNVRHNCCRACLWTPRPVACWQCASPSQGSLGEGALCPSCVASQAELDAELGGCPPDGLQPPLVNRIAYWIDDVPGALPFLASAVLALLFWFVATVPVWWTATGLCVWGCRLANRDAADVVTLPIRGMFAGAGCFIAWNVVAWPVAVLDVVKWILERIERKSA